MLRWLNRWMHQVENRYDRLKWAIRRRLGVAPILIYPYDGFGTTTKFTVLGRVLADYNVTPATETNNMWHNLINMARRFHSHEIPHARIEVSIQDQKAIVQADEEGHFHLEINLQEPIVPDKLWQEVQLKLVDPPGMSVEPVTGKVLVPPANARFGVISDLDDTVIQTDVWSVLQAARNTFLHNAYSRLAFPGVAAFYQALQLGTNSSMNPIFYVSNMPWNLYDLMSDFFDIRDIPRGPMFLTTLGLTDSHFIRRPGRVHKLEHIDHILNTYPHLPFVLIGDAGEEDPDIYFETLRSYPERIKAIYIRDVIGNKNDDAIRDLILKAAQLHVDLLLVPDTLVAAEHAAQHGYITPESVKIIHAEIQQTD